MRCLFLLFLTLNFTFLHAFNADHIDVVQVSGDQNQSSIEVYIKWPKDHLSFTEIENGFLLNLNVVLKINSTEGSVLSDTFEINSGTLPIPRDLYSKRVYYLAGDGEYDLELITKQKDEVDHRITKRFTLSELKSDQPSISDPILLSSMHKIEGISGPLIKNGYRIQPLFGHNSRREKELIVHFETYNNDSDSEELFVQLTVKNQKGDYLKSIVRPLKDNISGSYYIPVQTSDLGSDSYELELSLKKYPKGDLLATKNKRFYRENPFISLDVDSIETYLDHEFTSDFDDEELNYCMRAVVPVILQSFSENWSVIKKRGTLREKQKELLRYYIHLDHNLFFDLFVDHMKKIEFANHFYESGLGYGFESDRGVIFLKYGKPNDIFLEEHEASAPPYEIWSYNLLERTGQTNVKFIFYNPSLAPGNFILLHSNANGEINNPRWKLDLYRNSPWDHMSNDINETEVRRNFNRNAGKNFQDF